MLCVFNSLEKKLLNVADLDLLTSLDGSQNMDVMLYVNGLVQDCRNSSALAMELLQSCTKPSIYDVW